MFVVIQGSDSFSMMLAIGVDMAEPWKVMFYHLQSQRGTKCKYSWGVSVLHPVHAFMYLTHVLPR